MIGRRRHAGPETPANQPLLKGSRTVMAPVRSVRGHHRMSATRRKVGLRFHGYESGFQIFPGRGRFNDRPAFAAARQ
jgi:hypothetical protein